jgi:hypothetical protein
MGAKENTATEKGENEAAFAEKSSIHTLMGKLS